MNIIFFIGNIDYSNLQWSFSYATTDDGVPDIVLTSSSLGVAKYLTRSSFSFLIFSLIVYFSRWGTFKKPINFLDHFLKIWFLQT
jgi:hypothetical protein